MALPTAATNPGLIIPLLLWATYFFFFASPRRRRRTTTDAQRHFVRRVRRDLLGDASGAASDEAWGTGPGVLASSRVHVVINGVFVLLLVLEGRPGVAAMPLLSVVLHEAPRLLSTNERREAERMQLGYRLGMLLPLWIFGTVPNLVTGSFARRTLAMRSLGGLSVFEGLEEITLSTGILAVSLAMNMRSWEPLAMFAQVYVTVVLPVVLCGFRGAIHAKLAHVAEGFVAIPQRLVLIVNVVPLFFVMPIYRSVDVAPVGSENVLAAAGALLLAVAAKKNITSTCGTDAVDLPQMRTHRLVLAGSQILCTAAAVVAVGWLVYFQMLPFEAVAWTTAAFVGGGVASVVGRERCSALLFATQLAVITACVVRAAQWSTLVLHVLGVLRLASAFSADLDLVHFLVSNLTLAAFSFVGAPGLQDLQMQLALAVCGVSAGTATCASLQAVRSVASAKMKAQDFRDHALKQKFVAVSAALTMVLEDVDNEAESLAETEVESLKSFLELGRRLSDQGYDVTVLPTAMRCKTLGERVRRVGDVMKEWRERWGTDVVIETKPDDAESVQAKLDWVLVRLVLAGLHINQGKRRLVVTVQGGPPASATSVTLELSRLDERPLVDARPLLGRLDEYVGPLRERGVTVTSVWDGFGARTMMVRVVAECG